VLGGVTGPATPSGTLVLQHAEVLAALVLAQTACPGSPFVYGALSTMADMRTGAAHFGTPEFAFMAEISVRLARYCGLPVRAGAAVTDSHAPDGQAMLESALGLSAAARAGSDLLFQAAGVLSSFAVFSLEKFVWDSATIVALRREMEPLVVDDETLACGVIDHVGPSGSFLTSPHSRRRGRDRRPAGFPPRPTYGRWFAEGAEDSSTTAARHAAMLIDAHEAPDDLDKVVRRQLDRYCLA
jgi:trimethylamine--corrinoid protein Co-methyltransferase